MAPVRLNHAGRFSCFSDNWCLTWAAASILQLFRWTIFSQGTNQHLILGNNKELKTDSACVDNDATCCFDRIIVLQGMIAAGRLTWHAKESHPDPPEALKRTRYSAKTPNWVSPTTHTLQVSLGATESDYFICQVVRSTSPSAFGPCNIGNVKEEDYFSFRKASFLAGANQMPMLVPLLHHQNECFLGLFSSTLYCTPGPEETFPSSTQINILCDWLATWFLDQCMSGEFCNLHQKQIPCEAGGWRLTLRTYSLAVTQELRRHAMQQAMISERRSNIIWWEENCSRLSNQLVD